MVRFWGKMLAADVSCNFGGPAGGSRTWKGAFAPRGDATWLVETEMAFSSRRVILSRRKRRQIVARLLGGFSKKYFTKMTRRAFLSS